MAPSPLDHRQLSLFTTCTGACGPAFVSYSYYANQAMLEVRASGE
jgi:hypothetical protein